MSNLTFKQFAADIRKKRLAKGWSSGVYTVEGKRVELKGYETWLQRYTVEGTDYSNVSDVRVGQFTIDLAAPFSED